MEINFSLFFIETFEIELSSEGKNFKFEKLNLKASLLIFDPILEMFAEIIKLKSKEDFH
jgi:hypothetical protein